ncbi:hypothetical protein [Geodermatophilus saharensis]|nr:hypothetical protein [Geodermatophilus saharensis]
MTDDPSREDHERLREQLAASREDRLADVRLRLLGRTEDLNPD